MSRFTHMDISTRPFDLALLGRACHKGRQKDDQTSVGSSIVIIVRCFCLRRPPRLSGDNECVLSDVFKK